jgi:hypothetical protein
MTWGPFIGGIITGLLVSAIRDLYFWWRGRQAP